MNLEEFIKAIKEFNLVLTTEQINQLTYYKDFLIDYNKHTNLTRIINEEDIYLKHFYDSLTILKTNDLTKIKNILDIGTGAGFPGMILKIIFPHLHITLLDSNNKKTKFLQELNKNLKLENLTIINERAEIFAKDNIEKYDIVTSRAVANIITLLELSIPMIKINGLFIALKGNLEKEPDPTYAINTLNSKYINTIKFNLPIENSIRNIITIQKIKQTPVKYPRQYDKIIKKPLLK